MTTFRIGTASWTIPTVLKPLFPDGPSHLARYARSFNAVEINSSFHRPHQARTYARWAATAEEDFRFSVKLPRAVTHEGRLLRADAELDVFLDAVAALGSRLGPLLMQLPPGLAYDPPVAERFLRRLRGRHAGPVVCEPRHAGWFSPGAEALLTGMDIARAAADPAPVPAAAIPGGAMGLAYVRLHGTPRMYHSSYAPPRLAGLARRLRGIASPEVWCVFDNTAAGAATANALDLVGLMRADGTGASARPERHEPVAAGRCPTPLDRLV